MNGIRIGSLAHSKVEGAWFEDNIRKLDSALAVIRQDSYGKYLEYYPPVYIVAKCLDYLRPFIKEVSLREDANGNHCSLPTVRATIQGAQEGPTPAKPRTPTTTKTFFKKINPFSQNSSEENKTKAPPGNEPEKSQSLEKETRSSRNVWKIQQEQQEEFFYPAEASDIDEEDDSDMEGGYTFNHGDMEPDRVSMVSNKSNKSVKEAAEQYERELKVKLMENFVSPDNHQDLEDIKKTDSHKRFKKTNSLKRIFSKKGK